MSTEQIKIGEQTLEIETRPITLIFANPKMSLGPPIKYPQRVPLDPTVTTYHAERVQRLHADFDKAWRLFHTNTSPSDSWWSAQPDEIVVNADEIRKMGPAAIHLMGLIDMTLKFQDKKIPIAWVHPETYMHPAWAVALGDLAIFFKERSETIN